MIQDPGPAVAPQRPSTVRQVLAFARNTWRSLTSMRTALVLLFLLAIAAIPGALLPQRSLNEGKVNQYLLDRPTVGAVMDRLQLFDVFSSFWFTSVYALLFISLIGCILPRTVDHARALRTPPVPLPRNLSRLPWHARHTVELGSEEVAQAARKTLRGWRMRDESEGADPQTATVRISAEKGYLREFGNLVFHVSLVGVLAAVAVGKILGYEGSVIVIANGEHGFCNSTPAVYDSFRAGLSEDGTGLAPFCVRVQDFRADYLETGQAEMFTANIQYQAGEDLVTGQWRDYRLRVNDPLRIEGDRVYLIGHGYAPRFTVTFPNGETRTEAIQFAPQEQVTFLSAGALRFDPPGGLYPDDTERRKNQIAIEGLFAPTALLHGSLLTSSFPAMLDPAVAVDIYRGDSGLDTGKPQSIFALDRDLIDQDRLVRQERVNLMPGESVTLNDGTQVRFDDAEEWVSLQVSHDPAQNWVLVFAITMIGGLLVSLLVKRRRVWVRIAQAPDAANAEVRRTVVELGGLARTDQAGWGDEFDRLRERMLAHKETAGPQGTGARG